MPTPDYYEGKQTVDKQERIAEMLVARGVDHARAFDAATAVKYVDRCGTKPGESEDRDLGKAADYLFRAMTGLWPWEAK